MKKIQTIYLVIAHRQEPVRVRGERNAISYAHWKGYKKFVVIKETEYWRSLLDTIFDRLGNE